MTDALHLEVKKDGFAQLQTGNYKLTLTLNPTDLTDNSQELLLDFIKAPMGEIYMLGMARVGEQAPDAPQKPTSAPEKKKPQRHFKNMPRSQQAGMACGDIAFQRWICPPGIEIDGQIAAYWLRKKLGVPSRAALDESSYEDKAMEWDVLYARFEQETGRVPEVR